MSLLSLIGGKEIKIINEEVSDLICQRCGGKEMNFTSEQVSTKIRQKRMGIIYRLGRLTLIICTFGLWLIMGAKKQTGRMQYKYRTVAICQSCGSKQEVKQ